MTELENWMCCFMGTQLNTYFSPWNLPNLSEAQNFSAANTNMVLNFPKLERHILLWKALQVRNANHSAQSGSIHPPEIAEYLHSAKNKKHTSITFIHINFTMITRPPGFAQAIVL